MNTIVRLDPALPGSPLPHHWSACVGGGRVAEAMRADFQRHLELVQREMPFRYLRMHGLFHEDMMTCREVGGRLVYNWQYVDLVFDHWLSCGIRPFVELGFMPYALASGPETVFWWKGNVTPPRDWERWSELLNRFAEHCIERYGLAEVRRWYFEVWNEPNLPFFWKDADFPAYLRLYETSVRALKRIDAGLRVGGPSSAGSGGIGGTAPWGREFLTALRERNLPIDFYSTHPYPTDHPADLDGGGGCHMTWDGPHRLLTDIDGYRRTLDELGYGGLERHYTEWNSSPSARDPVHDLAFMAPFIVQNNWLARRRVDSLSFWTLSDIFEEDGIGDLPLHGGFGMIGIQGLKKPSFHGYWFLARLGTEELASGDCWCLTRRADGGLAFLAWNYCHYTDAGNDSRIFQRSPPLEIYQHFAEHGDLDLTLDLSACRGGRPLRLFRCDRRQGSVHDAWAAMGAPAHLLPQDVALLRRRAELAAEALAPCERLDLRIPPHGVVLLEIG